MELSPPGQIWSLQLLGPLRLIGPQGTIDRFRTRKAALLLAYLACHCDRRHQRDQLIQLCWPNSTLSVGRNRLRVELSWLRQVLETPCLKGQVLVSLGSTLQLNPALGSTDAAQFEQQCRRASLLAEPPARLAALQAAIALYQGDFLDEFAIASEEEDWIDLERQKLKTQYLEALCSLSETCIQIQDLGQALEYADQALRQDNCCEVAYQHLIRIYLQIQQPHTAFEKYQILKKRLSEELNLAPSVSTQNLLQSGFAQALPPL